MTAGKKISRQIYYTRAVQSYTEEALKTSERISLTKRKDIVNE